MKKIVKTIMMAVACGGLFPAAAAAQSYQLVTADSQLESGKRYLIVAQYGTQYYAWNGFDASRNCGFTTTVSAPSGGIITPAAAVVPVQLVQSAGTWKILDTATEKYVGATSGSSTDLVGGSIAGNYYLWYISIDAGTASVQNNGNYSHYLEFNYNLGSSFFRAYGNGDFTGIALYKETGTSLILYNGIDNSDAISAAAGGTRDVILQNRTLYKDGAWNTLCLPFNLTLSGSILDGATVMELDVTGIYDTDKKTGLAADGTLYLYFKEATSIEAGKPYIVKWASGDDIVNPTFSGVTISSTTATTVTAANSGLSTVEFCGTYSPEVFAAGTARKDILFLGDANKLYYPNGSAESRVNTCRAYFHVDLTGTVNAVREFKLNFGDDKNEALSIANCQLSIGEADAWYNLAGQRLWKKQKGINIVNGKKFMIK